MKPAATTLRAYAADRRRRGLPGGSHESVRKAIQAGRLVRSIGRDGRGGAVVLDVRLADQEWLQNTDAGRRRGAAPAAARAAQPPADDQAGVSFARANALEKVYKARLAQLEYEERAGKVVRADAIMAEWQKVISISRSKLLALPTRAKQRLPHLSVDDVVVLGDLVREALEELASGGEAQEERRPAP